MTISYKINSPSVKVLGVKVNILKREEMSGALTSLMEHKGASIITTPNAEIISQAIHDDELREIINSTSALNLADGVGVLWASHFQSIRSPKGLWSPVAILIQWLCTLILIPIFPKLITKPIPEKISGSDFIWDLARFAATNHYKIFLLGGAPTVAERCALELQTAIPDLRIGGVYSGHSSEVNKAVDSIRKSHSEILLVAFGAPKQEKWLANNLVNTGCKIGIGLGGTFDYVAGVKRRAPKLVSKIGLEWLYRLIQEPKRIIRQLSLPKFAWLVLISKIKERTND